MLLNACSTTPADPAEDEDAHPVSGIEVRDYGNNYLGTVGSPDGTGYAGANLHAMAVYPNPVMPGAPFRIDFRLNESASIAVRLEQAPPTDALHDDVTDIIPDFPKTDRQVMQPSIHSGQMNRGSYSVSAQARDAAERPLGAGYYQVIVETDDGRAWLDLFVVEGERDVEYLLGMEPLTSKIGSPATPQ